MLLFMTDIQKLSADASLIGKQQRQATEAQGMEIEHLRRVIEEMAQSQLKNSEPKLQKFRAHRPRKKNLNSTIPATPAGKFANQRRRCQLLTKIKAKKRL
jgi:hypothetical protein